MKFLLRSRLFSFRSKKLAFTAAALCLLLISGLVLKGLFMSPKEEMKKEMAFVMDPKTVQYQVKPKEHRNVKGYVWVNPESNELLLLVNGIQPISEKDYQVWIIYNRERSNGGLIQWRNGMGLLYVQPPNVTQIENIAVTVEPKGGSNLPTAPDAMLVDLKEEPVNRIY
nr:anti-sigma factor [Ammoniphilus resinae]